MLAYLLVAQVLLTPSATLDGRCGFARFEPLLELHPEPGLVISRPAVEYPPEAVGRGLSGRVALRVVVDRRGDVVATCAVVQEGQTPPDHILIKAARSASQHWKFRPNFGAPDEKQGLPFDYVVVRLWIDYEFPGDTGIGPTSAAGEDTDAEDLLAGVQVARTLPSELVARWGKPTAIAEERSEDGTTRVLAWEDGAVRREVRVPAARGASGRCGRECPISRVTVSGVSTTGSMDMRTGRGVRLGDSVERVQRVYGAGYREARVGDGERELSYEWDHNRILRFRIDRTGHVDSIQLRVK